MKQFYTFIFFILSFQVYAQKELKIINGIVSSDSKAIENVHIINISSNRGTISNNFGEFKISAKENDTISFSNIQFQTKWILINIQHLNSKILKIKLFQKTNNLPEVVVQNMAKSLGLPNADKKPLNKLERNLNAYSQKSTPMVFLDALLLGPILNNVPFVKQRKGGIDDIYNIISGNRKRDRKLKKLLDEDEKSEITQEYIQRIRDHFQDDFFTKTLKISKENINDFIEFCLPEGIVNLFEKQRYLEIVDIFIQNKEVK